MSVHRPATTWADVVRFYACALPMLALMGWMVMMPKHFVATLGKMADYVWRMIG